MKVCPKCGSSEDDWQTFCSACGAKFQAAEEVKTSNGTQESGRKKKIGKVNIFLLIWSVATSIGCIALCISLVDCKSSLSWFTGSYERVKSNYDTLKGDYEKLQEDYEKLQESGRKIAVESLEIARKYNFFKANAVVVPDDGKKLYHRYECEDCDTSYGFWIYNDEAAAMKYDPCPKCIEQ